MRKAKIIIADNMSDETYNMLIKGVTEKLGNDIEFKKIIDNSIVGGFILKLDGVVYDNCLKTQLQRLKEHISN